MLTYIASVSYVEPGSGQSATARAELEYTLVSSGSNAVLLTLYAPDGTVLTNSEGEATIWARAYDGEKQLTLDDTAFAWSYFVSGEWKTLDGSWLGLRLVGGSFTGTTTVRCEMAYKGNVYTATITIVDKTDTIYATIEALSGSVLRNATGASVLFCRLWQSAEEIDPLLTNTFWTSFPTDADAGDIGYRHYSGSHIVNPWIRQEDGTWRNIINEEGYVPKYIYRWYRRDKDGEPMDSEPFVRGKLVNARDVDVDEKAVYICEVSDRSGKLVASAHITIADLNDPVVSSTAPPNPATGQLWLDTSGNNDVLKRWNGAQWIDSTLTPEELSNIYANIERNTTAINQTDTSIRLLVEQTKVQLDSALAGLESSLQSAITQTAKDITFAFNEATNYTVTATGDILEYINQIQSYQRFSADGLELGVLGSPFLARLGNTKLSFIQDGKEIAYISNNRLYITEARITNKLSMGTEENGCFEWITTDAGLALKWRG